MKNARFRKTRVRALLALLLSFVLISASSAVAQGGGVNLTVVLDADPPRLDPFYSSAWVEEQVLHNVFDKLFEVDVNLNIQPSLVTSYEVTEDGLTYTFQLRDDVTFHDGTVLDAEAVKFNLDAILNAPSESARYSEINAITSVEVTAPYEFVIRVDQPATPLIGALANRAGMIASPTQIEALGREGFRDHPVGSGPFVFSSRVRNSHIVLEKNPNYWQEGLPVADQVTYRIITDQDVAVLNLQSGQVDILQARSIADHIMPILDANPQIVLDVQPGIGWQGLWLNTLEPPFDNIWLRRAVDVAVDREVLVQVAYAGAAEVAWGPFSPRSPYSDGKQQLRDVEKAREYLAEGGYPDGFEFTLTIGTSAQYQRIGEIIQNLLSEVGVKVTLRVLDYGQVLSELYDGNFQASLAGWNGRVDPDGDIYGFHYTDGSNNYSGYSKAEVDSLLDESRRLPNGAERKAVIQSVLDIVREDVPYIYLVHPSQRHAYRSNVTGMSVHPDGMVRLLEVGKE